MSADSIDYDGIMHANLVRVFGERDASRRMNAIPELYADDATLFEPDAVATGCLLYTSPSPRDRTRSRMPSSA